MELVNQSHDSKRHSTTKLDYCKFRKITFIKFVDIDIWKVIKEGICVPTKKVDGKDVPKPNWSVDDY